MRVNAQLKAKFPSRNDLSDLEKQKEIADYLDSVYVKALKGKVQNKITKLEEMKESILDDAFNHGMR